MLEITRWLIEERAKAESPAPARAPSPARCAKRARQARHRARMKNGAAIFRLQLAEDQIAEALIISKRMSEAATAERAAIERELAAVVQEWAERWLSGKGRVPFAARPTWHHRG